MDKSQSNSGDGQAASGAAKPPSGGAADGSGAAAANLVVAPAFGPDAENIRSTARSRNGRLALLAATIALAAGLGSFVGALSASAILNRASQQVAITPAARVRDVAELSSIKSAVDAANRSQSVQIGKLASRVESLERANTESTATLTRIAAAVDRIDRRASAAPETTGSIQAAAREAAPAAVPAPKPSARIVSGWIVEGVHGGRALVGSRYHGEFVVGAGSVLPGLGSVAAVKRQDGRWIVVTENGVIVSPR